MGNGERIGGRLEWELSEKVVDAAFRVHKALGPGLLESVYEQCLAYELRAVGLAVQTQVQLPVVYQGIRLEGAFRVDLLVEGRLVIEVKAAENPSPVHSSQLLTYLKLSGRRVGLLINFNVPVIREGLKRLVL